jgi:hypothetical protein
MELVRAIFRYGPPKQEAPRWFHNAVQDVEIRSGGRLGVVNDGETVTPFGSLLPEPAKA